MPVARNEHTSMINIHVLVAKASSDSQERNQLTLSERAVTNYKPSK